MHAKINLQDQEAHGRDYTKMFENNVSKNPETKTQVSSREL